MSAKPEIFGQVSSPDENATGFVQTPLDPLRYDSDRPLDPDEVPGIVGDMIPPGSRVLDVGCGAGALARVLQATTDAELLGIEPDPIRAERARSYGLNVRTGYLSRDLIQEIGVFDVVLFADVLEHLPNPHSMLLLSRDALKPAGVVIVAVPNVAHWSVRLCLLRGRFEYQPSGIMDATHLRWFTAENIRLLLTSAGFRIIKYRATAGPGLPDNEFRAPLRWLSSGQRASALRLGCRVWPTLFGAQHVVKAEMQ